MLLFRLKKNGEVMKGQYKYIKLNNNRKTISVGEWTSDKTNPSTEELDPRLQVIIVYMMSAMQKVLQVIKPNRFLYYVV